MHSVSFWRPGITAVGLFGLIVLGVGLSLSTGAFDTGWAGALLHLWQDDGSNAAFSVRELRLPRVLCALGVGASMALSGALIQVITRNPLGDPGLTGVSGGAAFGVALCLTLISAAPSAIVTSGIAGGMFAATLTFTIAGTSAARPMQLVLAGVSVSVFFIAATSAVMILAKSSMQTLYFWMIGGFTNRDWAEFKMFWPWALGAALAAFLLSPILGYLRFGDEQAATMGLNAARWRVTAGLIAVVLAAVSVAVAGPIGFVGFLAPHLARLSLGSAAQISWLWLLLSALGGAAIVVWADTFARLYFEGRAPAGVTITILGGFAFLILVRTMRPTA
ncbi:iron ABC transporter permease [Rhodobacteraceae bacterium G21628-S1]|nr:iron ABC transporter permease [Rhodobacteraceae bacterium G21628-S1]